MTDLMSRRTDGFTEPIVLLFRGEGKLYPMTTTGMRDEWAGPNWDQYAGRKYKDHDISEAIEVPTVHIEKLTYSPGDLKEFLNYVGRKSGKYAWRNAFLECLQIFLEP